LFSSTKALLLTRFGAGFEEGGLETAKILSSFARLETFTEDSLTLSLVARKE
jgi:hypothetical protein